MTDQELKPCPFCGGKAIHRYHIRRVMTGESDSYGRPTTEILTHEDSVLCTNYECSASIIKYSDGLYGNQGATIKLWNRRA